MTPPPPAEVAVDTRIQTIFRTVGILAPVAFLTAAKVPTRTLQPPVVPPAAAEARGPEVKTVEAHAAGDSISRLR